MKMHDPAPTLTQDATTHDIAALRKGILDARADFARLYDFYAGNCDTERFAEFLATGGYFTSPLTRLAWTRTIFKEIDRIEATIAD